MRSFTCGFGVVRLALVAAIVAGGAVTASRSVAQQSADPFSAPPPASAKPAPKRERIVYRVRHLPATELVTLVGNVFDAEIVATGHGNPAEIRSRPLLSADALGNNLVISVPEGQAEPVLDLIEALDRPRPLLRLQVVLVESRGEGSPDEVAKELTVRSQKAGVKEVLERLKGDGDLRVLASTMIHVVDSQTASVQIGGQVPRISGVSMTPRGAANQVSFQETGLRVSLSPRICTPEQIAMEVQIEQSRPAPESQAAPLTAPENPAAPRVGGVQTLELQTTVSAPVPGTLLLGGLWDRDEHGWRELLILVDPVIVFTERQ